jgi:lycopene cyclase domain-containing protein
MKFTYLLIDLLTLLVPLLFSFHPRLNFYKHWRSFFPAAIISAALFIPFDIYFTHAKVWGFNPAYVTGVYFNNLPIEEVMFFLCIPYSCVFTYHCLSALFKMNLAVKAVNAITPVLVLCCVVLAVLYYQRYYTFFAFSLLAILLVTTQFVFKIKWLSKFYITYAILLLPFLIVNGLLTGTGLKRPIVWYNNAETIGIRILTIPIEDVFYGMGLILLNLLIFTAFKRKFYAHIKFKRTSLKYPIPLTK